MGKLIQERYRAWVQSLPLSERDKPYVVSLTLGRDVLLSPEQVLKHMEQGTAEGQAQQAAEEKLLQFFQKRKSRFYR